VCSCFIVTVESCWQRMLLCHATRAIGLLNKRLNRGYCCISKHIPVSLHDIGPRCKQVSILYYSAPKSQLGWLSLLQSPILLPQVTAKHQEISVIKGKTLIKERF